MNITTFIILYPEEIIAQYKAIKIFLLRKDLIFY